MHIHSTFHQNLRAKNFKTNFSSETKLPVMLLLSEFLFFQCIGIRKLRGLARPLNVIESSYNFAGFISMSKRNIKSVGQSCLRTFIFWDTPRRKHTHCDTHTHEHPHTHMNLYNRKTSNQSLLLVLMFEEQIHTVD